MDHFTNKKIRQAEKAEDVIKYGIWHLAKREHSISELREKLHRKTDNQDWIEEALEELERQNYLNERRYIENALRYYNEVKHYGPSRIRQEFRQKGADNNILSEMMMESEFDYYQSALEVLNNKQRNPIEDHKERDRLTRYLISRGFDFDMIKYAFSEHLKD